MQQPVRISRYEIKTLIGAGGMGSLYLARDTNPNTNRLVALKLLNATLDSGELRDRFGREARALAALNHPSIVDIYDSGEFRGSPFIVMEYVRGETLAEKIKRRAPISLAQKLKLMTELCSGLAHAHEAGIVHRDIKPANLMVDQHGRLKILDFGIARMHEASMTRVGQQMTQINVRIGTPGYMSPEQIEGGEIDRRSDIFAVGAVFYEFLAYREAFTGTNTRQIENKVLESHPVPLTSIVPDLAPEVQAIITTALAKNPRDRYQDAASLEEALEHQRWKMGPADPAPGARSTPTPRASGPGPHESRADAAYQRSQHVFLEGATEAARRFAIEALAEEPDHPLARAFIDRLGADSFPPPPPPSSARATLPPTMLADGSDAEQWDDAASAPTVLSSGSRPSQRKSSARQDSFLMRHGKALQIAGITIGVAVVLAVAVVVARWFWPYGPLLTVTRPTGGTVWTSGINCGTDSSDCTANIAEGEMLQLRQEPDTGYVFTGFGGDCTKSGRVHMTRPMTCTATFGPVGAPPPVSTSSLTIHKPENGLIVGPNGIRCGLSDSACTAQYPEGTQITLRAIADTNYSFRGFTGDCNSKGELVMRGSRTCSAAFAAEAKIAGKPAPPVGSSPPGTRGFPPRTGSGGPAGPTAGGGGSSASGVDLEPSRPPPASPLGPETVDPMKPAAPPPPEEPRRTPPPPPLSPEALAKKDIEQTLEEYRKAYEQMDLKGIQRHYPAARTDLLKRGFDTYKSLKYAFEGAPELVDVDPSQGVATAKVKTLLTPEPEAGSVKPTRKEETFSLENRHNIWVISGYKFAILR